jgi:hypothetical protein
VTGDRVQVLGVDDWAWKKGTTFGTIPGPPHYKFCNEKWM